MKGANSNVNEQSNFKCSDQTDYRELIRPELELAFWYVAILQFRVRRIFSVPFK